MCQQQNAAMIRFRIIRLLLQKSIGQTILQFIYFFVIIKLCFHLTNKTNTGQYTHNVPSFLANASNPYLKVHENVCSMDVNLSSIIVVHSAVEHSLNREVIRATWGNSSYLKHFNMKILFFLGVPSTSYRQKLIDHESSRHRDIVQGSFYDSYENLTHKAVLVLKWITENCIHINTVIKTDDDVFINIPYTQKIVSNFPDRHILCDVRFKGDLSTSVIHRFYSKWRVNLNEFKMYVSYPFNFCAGYIVLLRANLVRQLFEASKTTPMFWIDDVYVYGILAQKTGIAGHQTTSSITYDEDYATECFQRRKEKCTLIGTLTEDLQTIYTFWDIINRS